jgi:hypothetical protein
LRYKENPFGYTPYCTICELHNPAEEDIRLVEAINLYKKPIKISKLSLWSFEENFESLRRFHEVELIDRSTVNGAEQKNAADGKTRC